MIHLIIYDNKSQLIKLTIRSFSNLDLLSDHFQISSYQDLSTFYIKRE